VAELVTTAAIHPKDIAGEAPTLSPFAPAAPVDLDQHHELGQFLTPNPIAEFMASLFEIPRSEVQLLDAGAGEDGRIKSGFNSLEFDGIRNQWKP
jgi:hypothetical protein